MFLQQASYTPSFGGLGIKRGIMVDLPARAAPIRDVAKRREVFRKIHTRLEGEGIGGLAREDEWVESSPLVHVEITAS